MSNTAAEFLDLVRVTPNTPEGARKIVENGKQALDRLDWEITQLFDQRRLVRGLIVQFAQLERVLVGAEPLSEQDVEEIDGRPTILTGDRVKRVILDIANQSPDDRVTVDFIIEEAQKRLWGHKLPWSNPKAAVGTMLHQSDDWLRVERGVFKRASNSEALERLLNLNRRTPGSRGAPKGPAANPGPRSSMDKS